MKMSAFRLIVSRPEPLAVAPAECEAQFCCAPPQVFIRRYNRYLCQFHKERYLEEETYLIRMGEQYGVARNANGGDNGRNEAGVRDGEPPSDT